ncbi:MAG: HPr family phosphocarrier protein, partial [Pseudomonadales bacterium]
MIRCELSIINKLGLHARAATKLASAAEHHQCRI